MQSEPQANARVGATNNAAADRFERCIGARKIELSRDTDAAARALVGAL